MKTKRPALHYMVSVSLLCLGFSVPAWGQDLPSGPDKGAAVPSLKVYDVTGPNKDMNLDYASSRKDKPTIFILIDAEKWDRPMARFLRTLDTAVQNEAEEGFVVAVWLTGDFETTKQYLPRAQLSLRLQSSALTCFEGEKTGPEKWNINPDAHLTAVVADQGKVLATFGYRSINETDVEKVQEAFKKR